MRFDPPGSKRLVYFVDDMNMPFVDKYDTQSAIELMRQSIDYKGWFDKVPPLPPPPSFSSRAAGVSKDLCTAAWPDRGSAHAFLTAIRGVADHVVSLTCAGEGGDEGGG